MICAKRAGLLNQPLQCRPDFVELIRGNLLATKTAFNQTLFSSVPLFARFQQLGQRIRQIDKKCLFQIFQLELVIHDQRGDLKSVGSSRRPQVELASQQVGNSLLSVVTRSERESK